MFSGRMEVLTDADGWILIDRNGKHFGAILNYLRDGTIPLPETRADGTAGRGQVLLCGRAGAGHRAEPGKIRSE